MRLACACWVLLLVFCCGSSSTSTKAFVLSSSRRRQTKTKIRRSTSSTTIASTTAAATLTPKQQQQQQQQHDATQHNIAASIAKGERRARERQAGSRELCQGCSRPPNMCVCSVLPEDGRRRLATQNTDILILQHPNEFRKRHVSTVPLIGLVLEDATIKVGYEFNKESFLDSLGIPKAQDDGSSNRKPKPLLLFPGKNAVDLDEYLHRRQEVSRTLDEKPTQTQTPPRNLLVLIDGTWAEAKRMARNSPNLLERCQMVQFPFEEEEGDTDTDSSDMRQIVQHQSVYNQVRREPEAHTISTLEAVAKALDIVEPPSAESELPLLSDGLNRVLEKHVSCCLHSSVTRRAPRYSRETNKRTAERKKRTIEIKQDLFSDDAADENDNQGNAITTLEDGAVLRPLLLADAPQIDDWWDHKSSTSLQRVARCIIADRATNSDACLGIYGPDDREQLRAGIVRYEGGFIGMLHVVEQYRRRGYGEALLRQATDAVEKSGEECIALIMKDNVASEKLFEKVGWQLERPTLKATGKRKANRRWIKK